jgi:uncharacterized membrane protein YhaH (DUF805 family)
MKLSYFSTTKGRLNRKQFWLAHLLLSIILTLGLVLYGFLVGAGVNKLNIEALSEFGKLFLIVATLIVWVRRSHDLGFSGWWVLACFVPIAGLVPIIFAMFWQGQKGANRFGEQGC